jgi:uncharacterized membrane protein
MSRLINSLNLKHILFHFAGMWLIAHAGQTFFFLDNVEVAELVRTTKYSEESMTAVSLSKLNISVAIGYIIGFVISVIISIIVSLRRRWLLINSIIAFVALFILTFYSITGWSVFKQIFLLPGESFDGSAYYLVNGTILLAIGLCFLLWRIERYKAKLNHNQV